ncbi:MAG: hypothetical protein LUQ41_04990 [Methanomicrobiales archaeon]|nr:hypothetical protein [Methanomicrobiales archaeon]
MASEKASPSWQVIAATSLILLTAIWIFFHIQAARYLLLLILAVFTVGIFVSYGIMTGSGRKSAPPLDPSTQMLVLFVLVYAMLFALFSRDIARMQTIWTAVMILSLIFLMVLGVFISGRRLGILIDSRNRMSLSTFQTILWTVIILSAFFTVAAALVQKDRAGDAFNIALDQQLWTLMGISITTLAGTPLLKDVKSTRTVAFRALKEYVRRNGERILRRIPQQTDIFTPTELPTLKNVDDLLNLSEARLRRVLERDHDGPLWIAPAAPDTNEVSAIDMFRGDEVVNSHRVDLAKVQMFFFTVVGALSYMLALAGWMSNLTLEGDIAFPAISAGFIAILGISHAGFLGNTAIAQTPQS